MRIWTTVMGQRLDGAENTRSMLLCAELLRRGHEVVMWTSAWDHIRKRWRDEWLASRGGPFRMPSGLEVRFLKGCGYTVNVSPRRFVDHWLAARAFADVARLASAPDAIVASLPDHFTAAAAVRFGRVCGAATVVDVRDKWPDIFLDRTTGRAKRALVRAALVRERRRAAGALAGADAVVAMMESMLKWGLDLAERPAGPRDRVFFLTTFPKNFGVARSSAPAHVAAALEMAAGRPLFTFVGTFNATQHPLLVLEAIDLLVASGRLNSSTAAFAIAGDGLDAEEVRRRAGRHANVSCVGWVDAEAMAALLGASAVGLLPMNYPSPAFNNKAFAYLASGLPIINGASGDLARLIEQEEIGLNVEAGSAASLAEAIDRLASDPERRARLTRNTRRVFAERFDREANYAAYAAHIERIAEDRRR